MADEVIEHGVEEQEEEEQVGEQVVEDPSEEAGTEEEETTGDDGMSEAELREARNLYKLLKDKSTQKNIIAILARQAGLIESDTTPKELRAAKKDLRAIVKEKLGPEYAFLTEKLGDVMEAVLESERQTVGEQLNVVSQKEVERETSSALDRLSRETKGESSKLESKMISLMDRIKPSDNLSVYEYLKDLYTLASSGKSAASAKAQIADKIRRNAGNAAERLQGKGAGAGGNPQGPEKKGLRASVEYAMQQMGVNKK